MVAQAAIWEVAGGGLMRVWCLCYPVHASLPTPRACLAAMVGRAFLASEGLIAMLLADTPRRTIGAAHFGVAPWHVVVDAATREQGSGREIW